ncbi:hypothetical protein DHEL01_v205782 [Diaporthe helianthi]|uniref:Aminoglycoside phosphotransferase domain-containing protein n=1 Tax=Diaporthe helianthi TaxID=158607 RepID=A0A2P5I045_DIAHE|nr:hypothetical protein DHEL01_v205782 [Diaporthe helianthi]
MVTMPSSSVIPPPQPVTPSHPRDWSFGIDEYLRENDISCDDAIPLNTGTSCYLWRLEGLRGPDVLVNGHTAGKPAIMKCADSTPKDQAFPVAADRLAVEVKALKSAAVAEACRQEPSVRVPVVLRATTNGFIMSDVGHTDLWTAYKADKSIDASAIGARLGRWLAHLHRAGIAQGQDGWKDMNDELRKFYVPGGIAESFVYAAVSSHEARERIMSALRAPPGARTLTPWDFRPMNVVLRANEHDRSAPDLAVVDWELCHYGDPADDVRMWFSEVLLLESRYGDRGMLSSFLSEYGKQAGPGILDQEFVCRVALSAGVYILFIMAVNPGVWDCTDTDAELWKDKALKYIQAGVERDLAWLRSTPLTHLVD